MTSLMTGAGFAAADTASTTSAWFALGGALGGVIITGAIALATAILNHRWQTRAADQQLHRDHTNQLRQERQETYARYWSAWNRLIHQLREVRRQAAAVEPNGVNPQTSEQARDAELEWRDAADALFLIASSAVISAAEEHVATTEIRIEAANKGEQASGKGSYLRLNEEMRKDIIDLPPS